MGVIVYTPIHNRKVEMQENTKFKITYYSNKDKKHITRNGTWTDKCRYWTSKAGANLMTFLMMTQRDIELPKAVGK